MSHLRLCLEIFCSLCLRNFHSSRSPFVTAFFCHGEGLWKLLVPFQGTSATWWTSTLPVRWGPLVEGVTLSPIGCCAISTSSPSPRWRTPASARSSPPSCSHGSVSHMGQWTVCVMPSHPILKEISGQLYLSRAKQSVHLQGKKSTIYLINTGRQGKSFNI